MVGGWLWSVAGAPATFVYGAWISGVALALMLAWLPWLRRKPEPKLPVPAPAQDAPA